MSDAGQAAATAAKGRSLVERAARACAIAGALLILAMAALTVTSVAGRELAGRPLPGDFEIVSLGTAIAAFLCLPYCQLARGNLTVGFFLARASARLRGGLDAGAAALYGALALLLAWRMTLGMRDAIAHRDISVILGLPYWWAYPFAVLSLALLAAACAQTARAAWRGQ
jgi:TRAP-type C4-dicarboxylate transport system permease small subunit